MLNLTNTRQNCKTRYTKIANITDLRPPPKVLT